MKEVDFRGIEDTKEVKLTDILKSVTENSPQEALSVSVMRARVRVLDAIDGMGDSRRIVLENSDHEILKNAIERFPWARANRTLLAIIDAVAGARDIPMSVLVNEKRSA